MNIKDKINAIHGYCSKRGDCDGTFDGGVCPLMTDNHECRFTSELSEDGINKCFDLIFNSGEEPTETTEPTEPVHDVINHPSHYCQGGMECIDEMVLLFGKEAVKHFCLCNAWKYRKRCLYKNGEKDLKKSDWYIQKYKELGEEV